MTERPFCSSPTEIPPDRVAPFRALAARVPVEFALFGGGLHATGGVEDHGLPVRHIAQREVRGLAASGDYSAVVAGTVGRRALPGAALGARQAGVPFILWTALWAHPRSLAHLPGSLLLRVLYRRAAAVVTYGEHVSAFAARHGARDPIVAPQAVDGEFWGAAAAAPDEPRRLLFIGRDDPGKGVDWLLTAWEHSGLAAGGVRLELVGPSRAQLPGGVTALGALAPEAVRERLRGATAVVVPSERTATFREPWGLVCNEAMHAGVLVIGSTQVGPPSQGELVEDAVTGLGRHGGPMRRAWQMRCAAPARDPAARQHRRRRTAPRCSPSRLTRGRMPSPSRWPVR